MSDKISPLRPVTATKRARCRTASELSPGVVHFLAPQHSLHFPSALNTALCPKVSRPAALCSQAYQRAYRQIRLFMAERPLPILSKAIPAARKQARERKKNSGPFTPQLSPSSLVVWHASFHTAARQRRRLPPRPEKTFFRGWGEHERGRGSFYKKRPFPSRHPPAPRPFPNKKSGAVACTRFHRKNKGTLMCYFLSPLCLRLWPCCMK